jgi:hypothetical protein
MTRWIGWGLYTAIAVGCVICLVRLAADRPTARARPEPDPPAAERNPDEVVRRSVAAAARLGVKDRLSRQLATGQLGLLDAARRYRELAECNPEFNWELFRMHYPDASDDELFCRQAIDYAVCTAPEPDQAALRNRLETELGRHLRQGLRLQQ